jgi:hypothetical protein
VSRYEEYQAWVAEYRADDASRAQREGQLHFNALWYFEPDTAELIRMKPYDPFFVDEKLPAFLTWLQAYWEDEEV